MKLSQIKAAIQETFPEAQINEINEDQNYLQVKILGVELLIGEDDYEGHCEVDGDIDDWGADFETVEELIGYIKIDLKSIDHWNNVLKP